MIELLLFLMFIPLQHPAGKGFHRTIIHSFTRFNGKVEKTTGDLMLAQLFFNAQ